jgi:hypothetical protein
MKGKIFAVLAIVATMTALSSPAKADSGTQPANSPKDYTLSGASLLQINNRTASDDFAGFFNGNSGRSSVDNKPVNNQVNNQESKNINESITYSNIPVLLLPAESLNGYNDGLQVQFDIRE